MAEPVPEFGAADWPRAADGRLDAQAFHRNHAPIWSAIAPFMQTADGLALEIGSGSGQHVTAFARHAPAIRWYPSDPDPRHRASIAAWTRHAGLDNVAEPRALDLTRSDWDSDGDGLPAGEFCAIMCVNVLHIAPWAVAENLMTAAPRLLQGRGHVFLYGPYLRDGRHTAPSNAAFDASLRAQDPRWGVRDVADVAALARRAGLRLHSRIDMPANNQTLIFARGA
ncbi:MAG: DUF938 domain-containing protein [Proteobacteria bacterium]|nr:DUF938 domain-containing protein [Pseudomonadota bacterium]